MVKIHSFVYYEHPNTDYVIEHKHDSRECIFFIDGKATISTTKVAYTVSAPSIAMIPSYLVHDEKEITNTKMFIVLFDSEDNDEKEIIISTLSNEQNEKIRNIFEEMYELEKNKENKSEYQKQCSLFALVLSLLRAFRFMEKEDVDQTRLANFAKNHIEQNFSINIDYKALAESYGYSYSRFRHIFKNFTGMPPHQYCLYIRLNYVKKLLRETNEPISVIAKKCGFDNEIEFDIFFKKKMNISPKAFRKLVQVQEEGAVIRIGGRVSE